MITIQTIQFATSAHFGQPVEEMRSQRRARVSARPRQIAMYLSRQLTPLSLPAIGLMFGNRDHTTVIHAIETVENLMCRDVEVAYAVKELTKQLSPGRSHVSPDEYAVHVEAIVSEIRNLLLSLRPMASSEKLHARNS